MDKKNSTVSLKIKCYMYFLYKLTKLKYLAYTTSISVEKYVNIIKPCFQLLG